MRYIKLPFEILAESKKARALIVGLLILVLTPIAAKAGVEVPPDKIESALQLLMAYVVGQGLADIGKHRPPE
jgi:hypothetical protein